jgi:DNA repair exonuclease SbcCD ATPase subunit
MDINIILGILLILIVIYFMTLVIILRMRNQQVNQSIRWNNFRYHLFTQSRADQEKAHRISRSLQNRYKNFGAPYAEDLDQAIAILRAISKNTRKVLNDQNLRTAISQTPEPYSWKTFFIFPVLSEYKARQEWWNTTQELGVRLSRNPSGFSAVDKLEKRLASKGGNMKTEFLTLKNKAEQLIQAYQDEARTPTHFQDQIQQLEQLGQQIDETIQTNLSGTELSPKLVAKAAPRLESYQTQWNQLDLTLRESKHIRRDTRSQLEKNQAVIDTIKQLLDYEEEAGRTIKNYRQALCAEKNMLDEQEGLREAGNYLQIPVQEQYQRLKEIEKNLRVLIQERSKLGDRLARGEREIELTEAWITTIEPPFFVDQTNIILEEVQKQQSLLHQLIHANEDLDLINGQVFIDPQKLTNNRETFDHRIDTYLSLHQDLQQHIPPLIQQVRLAIQDLRHLNLRYHQGLDLETLMVQTLALEDDWAAAEFPSQIRESQIDLMIGDLRQLEKARQVINSACVKAENGYQTCSNDRTDAQRIIEDQGYTELHQVMQVISREDQVPLSGQARDYARQAEELNIALEQIDTDFGTATQEAASLLMNMKTLWRSYQKKYTVEKKEYQALAENLTALQSKLEKFERHELSAFHGKVLQPMASITDWLQAIPPQSIQAILNHNDAGYLIQVEVEKTVKELSKEDQNYTWAKEEALSSIEGAKAAIQEAEKEFLKIPWGVQKPMRRAKTAGQRSSALEHSYRYLDSAEAAYKEITDPEVEYHNSVDKAVSDLSERVQQNADNAKDEAKKIRGDTRDQINEINRKRKDLEKTLADGQGYAMRLEDTGFRSQWAQIYRKFSVYDEALENHTSYREAFSYLEQAIIETRYQIERMREFEGSDSKR